MADDRDSAPGFSEADRVDSADTSDEELDWDDEDAWDDEDEEEEGDGDDEFVQELRERGKCVFTHEWEGGAGAYASYVYKLGEDYYAYDMFEESVSGPFDALEIALPDEWLVVSSATVGIESSELPFEALTKMLTVETDAEDVITVNGKEWTTGA